MVDLSPEDRRALVTVLQDIPELITEQSRRLMLEMAGLKQLAPRIDVSGAPLIAVSQMVSFLAQHGRLSFEHEALGLFLNTMKSYVGVEQQAILDQMLIKYQMMIPIVSLPSIDDWRGTDRMATVQEKIIGENTLRPIAFLAHGLRAARSVAYIGVTDGARQWSGTGFLISPNLLFTNHHVLSSAQLLSGTAFHFNYEVNIYGQAEQIGEFTANPQGLFHVSAELDYALVELNGEPGREWGWLSLQNGQVRKGDRVNIIQHPHGRPKEISLQNNFVEFVGGNVVQYVTATEPGSSGSPVFNDQWELVAIHHAGGYMREPDSRQRYYRNEGILMGRILNDLPDHAKNRF